MKKLLTPFILALALIVTISSCTKEEECIQCGEYTGNVTGDLKVKFPPAADIDTTGLNVTSTIVIGKVVDAEDSVSLTISLEVDGTPITVNVNAAKNGENGFSVTNTIYKYAGIVPILVNGTGTADGTTCSANIKIAEGSGATTSIDGDLNFKSN